MLRRQWLPAAAVFSACLGITTLAVLLTQPIYQAEGKMAFKRTSTTPVITELGREVSQLDSLAEQGNPVNTEAEIIRSVDLVQKTIALLKLKGKGEQPLKPRDFLTSLNVQNISGTNVLQVSYRDHNPEQSARVVNTLMNVYLEHRQRENRADFEVARKFTEQQLPAAEAALSKAAAELRTFQEKNALVTLEEQEKSIVAVISSLEDRVAEARSSLADTNAQIAALEQQLGVSTRESLGATSLSQSPGVQGVLREFQQVESQLAIEQTRLRADHPLIISLTSQKERLAALLQQRVQQVVQSQRPVNGANFPGELKQKLTEELSSLEARRQGLNSRIAALASVSANYNQRANEMPKLRELQRKLENKLQASQTTYSFLTQKLQEIQLAENQNTINGRIIATAITPEVPVAPRKILYYAVGTILGGLLAAATALLLESRAKAPKLLQPATPQLGPQLGYPLLGMIPLIQEPDNAPLNGNAQKLIHPTVITRDTPWSPVSEAYRMVQSGLGLFGRNSAVKNVLITSALPHEGKSTVAANLAVVTAQLGYHVLLIDADLHSPSQHVTWKLPNQLGLVDAVYDASFRLRELNMLFHKVAKGLDVLTSGTPTKNPLAVLGSQRMRLLLEYASSIYDLVIIDSSSLTTAADALTLGKMVDGVLLVTRPEVADPASAEFVKLGLEQSHVNILGQVVNGYHPDHESQFYAHFARSPLLKDHLIT